jgi:hypothetical protein
MPSILAKIVDRLASADTILETYDRYGELVLRIRSWEMVDCIRAHRPEFAATSDRRVALLFRSEEAIEFLVAAFAAIAEGRTIVPLYPSWGEEHQRLYLGRHGLRCIAVGEGFRERVEGWKGMGLVDRIVPLCLPPSIPPRGRGLPPSIPPRGRGLPPSVPPRGRGFLVLGKASDRITLTNGLNYNPAFHEERIRSMDLEREGVVEDAVVIGDGQSHLGCILFLREPGRDGAVLRRYLADLVRDLNAGLRVEETTGPWEVSPAALAEAGVLGPSAKVIRRRVEEKYAGMFRGRVPTGG